MSRRARRQADARPWERERDGDAPDVDALLSDDDTDQHLRDRAWEQWEIERQRPQGDAR
jgi:hypothetical protein